jgi:membrane associated rhomboid family serine protease
LFILLVSIGVYALFGLQIFALPGIEQSIAWEAHIGGFLVGLLAFSLFDPVGNAIAARGADPPPSEQTSAQGDQENR